MKPHATTDQLVALAAQRRAQVLEYVQGGMTVIDACMKVGVSRHVIPQWRVRDKRWAAAFDIAKANHHAGVAPRDLTSAQFSLRYFGHVRTNFQQQWIDTVQKLRPGNIHLALWPPEYGKTTTFEDYATEKVARTQTWRSTVASEDNDISKRIVGKIRRRLESNGPTPLLVKDWGPFRPLTNSAAADRISLPWNNDHFTISSRMADDERDHTMLAIGWRGSTVSLRTDHLHVDDLQSLKTFGQTPKQLQWFRQDALSRPGETGITTICGTRVEDGDFYEALIEDPELDGILEVSMYPAIYKDEHGNDCALNPLKHDLDALDRIRRKIKDPAFDRNYLMKPNASKTKYTFGEEGWARAKMPSKTLNSPDLWNPDKPKPTMVFALDPGMDPGVCTLGGWVMTEDAMRLAYFAESNKFLTNEEIIAQLQAACRWAAPHYRLKNVIVEAKNFQRGLARDERLVALANNYSLRISEHLTGINKYDESIGLASMAGDWNAGKIQLPYSEDAETQTEMDEMWRQFKKWVPSPVTGLVARGNKVRYDRLMMTWFAWIWWVDHRHRLTRQVTTNWNRGGLPYAPTGMAPVIPIGARI
jgi:hypothetical protein